MSFDPPADLRLLQPQHQHLVMVVLLLAFEGPAVAAFCSPAAAIAVAAA